MQNFEVSFIAFVIVSSILIVGSAGLHEESTPDYYKTLGLSEDCAQDDVKKAFRRLAMKYHPDKCKEPDAEKKFQEIGEGNEKRLLLNIKLNNFAFIEMFRAYMSSIFVFISTDFLSYYYTIKKNNITICIRKSMLCMLYFCLLIIVL